MINMGEVFAYDRIGDIPMERVLLNERELGSFLVEPGDLLFARQSLVLSGAGKCSLFLGTDEPVTFESHLIRARLNPDIADPRFYYYFFRSRSGRNSIESIVEQVAAAGIRGSDLANLEVPYVPLTQQNRIASLLSVLDEKIELNRKMNQTLEQTASLLFKSWFTDFAPVRAKAMGRQPVGIDSESARLFPDRLEECDGVMTPSGWPSPSLGEQISFTKGRSYKREELSPSSTALVTLKSFQRHGGYRPDGLKSYCGAYKPEQVVEPGEIVIALTDVTQDAEVIGRPALVQPDPRYSKLVASLDVGIIRPQTEKLPTVFLYHLLKDMRFTQHILGFASGTTVLHLDSKGVASFRFALPPAPLLQLFERIAGEMHARKSLNEAEIRTLEDLRDALLPRLLSGELCISTNALDQEVLQMSAAVASPIPQSRF